MKLSDEAKLGFRLGFVAALALSGAFAAIMLSIFLL
jgi:hypothetical protein